MTGADLNESFDEKIKGFSVASLKKERSNFVGMTEERQSLIKVEHY